MNQPVINVIDPEVRAVLLNHDLSSASTLHTDYNVERCGCRKVVKAAPRPSSGDACGNCGGLTVRTGSCTTCTACGTTGGCG